MAFDDNMITVENATVIFKDAFDEDFFSGTFKDSPDYLYHYVGINGLPRRYCPAMCSYRLSSNKKTVMIFCGMQNCNIKASSDYIDIKGLDRYLFIPEDVNDKSFINEFEFAEYSIDISTWKNIDSPVFFLESFANDQCLQLECSKKADNTSTYLEHFFDIGLDFIIDYISSFLIYNDTFHDNQKHIRKMFKCVDLCFEHVKNVGCNVIQKYENVLNHASKLSEKETIIYHNYLIFTEMIVRSTCRKIMLKSTDGLGRISDYGFWDHFQRIQVGTDSSLRYHDWVNNMQ